VLETPGGRTFLYDVGSLQGPELVRRHVAPYLWQRGIRRIDEVFLSHADLDHFNGLAALLDRFAVGQVSCTPTFQDRQTPAARLILMELQRRRVPMRILSTGALLRSGDAEFDVLHPPAIGPDGNENARSLVMLVRHAGHNLLLTGDLEGAGLDRVTSQPAPRVDVLMAPHHGNHVATAAMVQWATPRMVVSCQGPPRAFLKKEDNFPLSTAPQFFGTWPHGAITVQSLPNSLVLDTFVSKQRWVVGSKQ
jgi:competence protein ComEC